MSSVEPGRVENDEGRRPDTVVLDLDGTLVDSAYAHALAWQAAFADVGVRVPAYRLHRSVGMGGDRLVAHVAGDQIEASLGDELRKRHPYHLDRFFDRITPIDGAVDLLKAIRDARMTTVLASSSDPELTDRLLHLVEGAHQLLNERLTGGDADRSKPSGQLIDAAVTTVSADRAIVVGDAVWDVRAAQDAGVPCVAVLTGGFCESELREAGAVDVAENVGELALRLRDHGSFTV